ILDGWSQQTQFWYYDSVRAARPLPGYVLPLPGQDGWQRTPAKIDEIMQDHPGIWLLDYGRNEVDAGQRVENYLARHYYQAFYEPIISNRVVYYIRASTGAPLVKSIQATCNGQLLLQDVTSQPGAVRAGEVVPLALRWRALAKLNTDYVVSWRLLDSAGHTVLQRDSEPDDGFSSTNTWQPNQDQVDRYGMLIPSFLPPGEYTAVVVVYDKMTGAACQWKHDHTILPSTVLPLRTVDVLDSTPLPALGAPKPEHPLSAHLGGLTLVGYDWENRTYRPGDVAAMRLYWRVEAALKDNVMVRARLASDNGTVVEDKQLVLGNAFPTSRWQAGRTIATYVDVPIPVTAVTGSLALTLSFQASGLSPTVVSTFPRLSVMARERTYSAPAIPIDKQANFGGSIALLGFGLQPAPDRTIAPGQTIQLNLYWKDLQGMTTSYKVFTHLVGPDGQIYGQQDAIPLAGDAPTNGWLPGEVLTDHYAIAVAPKAPPGTYHLVVGFYDSVTGARLPLADHSADSVTIAALQVAIP
ncbi:MAG TPA: hypothetical protein VKX96_05925, partial [Chloroflexota bacterium]|nr:hypothetical protein [Chloroflexota bacterium]